MDDETLSTVVARDVSNRTKFSEGDIRVKFEYVRQPKIDFLAQQVEADGFSGTFRLRPWNLFSEDHISASEDDSSEKPSTKRRKIPIWSNFADLVLSGL